MDLTRHPYEIQNLDLGVLKQNCIFPYGNLRVPGLTLRWSVLGLVLSVLLETHYEYI